MSQTLNEYKAASAEALRLKADSDRYQFIKAWYARMGNSGHYLNSPYLGRRDMTLDEVIDHEIANAP